MSQSEMKTTDPKASSLETGAEEEINLLELLLVLARNWRMIVGVPIVVAIITAIYSLLLPNIYTAKAMILSNDEGGGMMSTMLAQMGGLASLAGGMGGATKADLYIAIMKSETVKDSLIDRFKLMELYKAKLRTSVYNALDGKSVISPGKKDGIITIAVSDKDPKLAAEIANAYVEELGKRAIKLGMTGAGMNRVFLEERLVKAKVDLAAAENTLKSFQTKNKAMAVTDQARATLEGVARLRAELVAQEVQLAVLKRQFTEESQDVKRTSATIANLRSQIARMEGSASEGSMPGVGAMPQLGQEYMRLMREFKIQESLVELLTKQYEMTKLNEAKDVVPFQVFQTARVPELKSKPKRSIMVILATVTSGFLMIFLAFIREYVSKMNDEDRKRWQEMRSVLPHFRRSRY